MKTNKATKTNPRDKYENEDLIKYALPTDVWVHADGFSSPHGYIRTPFDPEVAAAAAAAAAQKGGAKKGAPPFVPPVPEIPAEVLEDCCQLIKEGSIKGCKEASRLRPPRRFRLLFGQKAAGSPALCSLVFVFVPPRSPLLSRSTKAGKKTPNTPRRRKKNTTSHNHNSPPCP
jgi:hypothetical protein